MNAGAAIFLAIGTMAAAPTAVAGQGPGIRAPASAEVVYVANAGFLIVVDGRKILVDGVFHLANPELPAPAIRNAVESGRTPFEDLDLILATHDHQDHFRAQSVVACLRQSPRAVFLGPPQTVHQLRDSVPDLGPLEARIRTIDVPLGEKRELEVAGIRVLVMSSGHGGLTDVQNYMYLLEWNGFTAFHEGDAPTGESLASWGLAEEDIDVALFHFGRLFRPGGMDLLAETVGARHFIPMHFAYTAAPDLASQIESRIQGRSDVHYQRQYLERVSLSRAPSGNDRR